MTLPPVSVADAPVRQVTEADRLPQDLAEAIEPNREWKAHQNNNLGANAAPEWFGLNREMGDVRLGFFVGVGRLPVAGLPVLNVQSRFMGLDYAEMFACCAAHAEVSGRLGKTFHVWPEQEAVPIGDAQQPEWFTRLLVYAFVNATAKLAARHLRRGSVRVVENLQGRVKGRIVVGEQVRQNLSRFRPDRSVCSFSRFEVDTRENRILRAALEVGAAFLGRRPINADTRMRPLIATSRAALAGVAVTRIHARDHLSARSSGAMSPYRAPLRLARAVLDHIGLDPEYLHIERAPQHVPPFALATAELFERYCEVMLRKTCPHMKALAEKEDNLGGAFGVRPDYLACCDGQGWIVDAKFKRDWCWTKRDHRGDVFQVMGYSRHKKVLEELHNLGAHQGTNPKIAILYPAMQGAPGWNGEQALGTADVSHALPDEFEVPLIRIPVRLPFRA